MRWKETLFRVETVIWAISACKVIIIVCCDTNMSPNRTMFFHTEAHVGRHTIGTLVNMEIGMVMFDVEKNKTLSSLTSNGNCVRHFPSNAQVSWPSQSLDIKFLTPILLRRAPVNLSWATTVKLRDWSCSKCRGPALKKSWKLWFYLRKLLELQLPLRSTRRRWLLKVFQLWRVGQILICPTVFISTSFVISVDDFFDQLQSN